MFTHFVRNPDVIDTLERIAMKNQESKKSNIIHCEYFDRLLLLSHSMYRDCPNGMLCLGLLSERGTELNSKEDQEAFYWYKKAAELSLPIAQYKVASMYASGTGVAYNHKEALKWTRLARANLEYFKDETCLNFAVSNWISKLAFAGNVNAKALLSIGLFIGSGFNKNVKEAIRWCQDARDDGHIAAGIYVNNTLTPSYYA